MGATSDSVLNTWSPDQILEFGALYGQITCLGMSGPRKMADGYCACDPVYLAVADEGGCHPTISRSLTVVMWNLDAGMCRHPKRA